MTLTDNLLKPFSARLEHLERLNSYRIDGRVTEVVGLVVEATCPAASLGDLCTIEAAEGATIRAEIMGFRDGKTLLMPL